MDRNKILELMKDVYTLSEAAKYLNISTQRLNQLVHDKRIEPIKVSKSTMLLLKGDLEKRKMTNVSNYNAKSHINQFNINTPYVRDAILYYTIQQYFNNNDKRTYVFIEQIEQFNSFDYRSEIES